MLLQKTHVVKGADIKPEWLVIDAAGIRLGKLASHVAQILRGKNKPTFTPHMDIGDHVIIINAEQIDVAESRRTTKFYYRHTQYPGGLRSERFDRLLARRPERVLEKAIKGMLPKGPLGDRMYRKLHVYAGGTHPHEAQKPREVRFA
jgi:large subunit ribosomal protein L13